MSSAALGSRRPRSRRQERRADRSTHCGSARSQLVGPECEITSERTGVVADRRGARIPATRFQRPVEGTDRDARRREAVATEGAREQRHPNSYRHPRPGVEPAHGACLRFGVPGHGEARSTARSVGPKEARVPSGAGRVAPRGRPSGPSGSPSGRGLVGSLPCNAARGRRQLQRARRRGRMGPPLRRGRLLSSHRRRRAGAPGMLVPDDGISMAERVAAEVGYVSVELPFARGRITGPPAP